MTIAFSGSEIIKVAIGVEERGIAFYDVMSRSTEDATARAAFHGLAEMERQHILIFQDMLAEAGKYQPAPPGDAEYNAYVQALVDNAVFTDDMATSETVSHAESTVAAVELAIGAEKDSILFYNAMKEIIPRQAQPTVDKVIAEEKLHLRQLSELKKKLQAP